MKLPLIPTQEIGSFRKPRYLIDKYKAWFSSKIDYNELKEAVEKASIDTIRLMEDAGLDIVWDGEMHRWEMYYHPVKYIDGIEFVGQVRVFDNRYFIKGSVVNEPRLMENYHLEEYLFIKNIAEKPVKIPITGPYTISDWSFNEYYIRKWSRAERDPKIVRKKAKEELTITLAKNVINPILRELVKHGVFRIQIDEPAATTHPDEMDIFVEAFNKAVEGVDTTITTHICYSDYNILIPYISEIKAVQFALEFANRDSWERGVSDDKRIGYSFLKKLYEYSYDKEIGLGVIDVHTNRIEPVELVMDRIEYALKYFEPEKLFINPDCGLRTRSRDVGAAKLRNMVDAVRRIRRKYGWI